MEEDRDGADIMIGRVTSSIRELLYLTTFCLKYPSRGVKVPCDAYLASREISTRMANSSVEHVRRDGSRRKHRRSRRGDWKEKLQKASIKIDVKQCSKGIHSYNLLWRYGVK